MTRHDVIDIKNTLKAKQLLQTFDQNLARLQKQGAEKNEKEFEVLELLAEYLEEAIENGVAPESLETRARTLGQLALSLGYGEREVNELLTLHPNPNGKRL